MVKKHSIFDFESISPDIPTETDEEKLFLGAFVDDIAQVNNSLKRNANVNFREEFSGMTALHIAIANRNFKVCTRLLLTGKCDLSLKDSKGNTAIDVFINQGLVP